jgi:hypothetical protein
VVQHSTGHNQQHDQLYVKEMCRAAWGKWWSHNTQTGFLIHASPFFEGVSDQQMHICIPSRVKTIDWCLVILFQLTDLLTRAVTTGNKQTKILPPKDSSFSVTKDC